MENVVMVKLSDYERLLTDKYIVQAELREERAKNSKMKDLKIYIMEKNFDEYKINSYDLEDLTDISNYGFGLRSPAKLLSLGIELDEMIEFIKFKYEEAHREDENADWRRKDTSIKRSFW